MTYSKEVNESNILRTWALLSEGHKLVKRSGIPVVIDKNNMVLLALSETEYQRVFDNKAIYFNKETQVVIMLRKEFVQQKTEKEESPGLKLF